MSIISDPTVYHACSVCLKCPHCVFLLRRETEINECESVGMVDPVSIDSIGSGVCAYLATAAHSAIQK